MRFTNKHNIPAPVCRAIEWQSNSHHPNSEISCTQLIDAPLVRWLYKKYYDYCVEDYSDRLWALYGSIAHFIMEKFGGGENADGEHVERTVATVVDGWKVSAQLDYLKASDRLTDYKFTSCWSTAEGIKIEWENQLNTGLWLWKHDDTSTENKAEVKNIKNLEICALFRDWTPSIADKFPTRVAVLPAVIWADKYADEYVHERVRLHQEAVKDLSAIPPICSDKERWMKDFAVMKEGRKNALKAKIKTREKAEEWMSDLGGDSIREAVPKRCAEYCIFGKANCYSEEGFCPWWNAETQETRTEPVMADVPTTEIEV